jgi:hypothetical protein
MRLWIACWLFSLASVLNAADNTPAAVMPMGVFSAVRSTADHTYGQKVRLWRTGTRVVGEVLYWDGNLEAQRGHFTDGAFVVNSGELRFRVTLVRSDVQPNRHAEASFEGFRARGGMHGKLTWRGEGAKAQGKRGSENWLLLPDLSEQLPTFNSIDAWQKDHPPVGRP